MPTDRPILVVKRLEDRDQMPKFAEIRENYFDKIGTAPDGPLLELGCGTGAVLPCDRVMGAKWLEILKRLHHSGRVGVLRDPTTPGGAGQMGASGHIVVRSRIETDGWT